MSDVPTPTPEQTAAFDGHRLFDELQLAHPDAYWPALLRRFHGEPEVLAALYAAMQIGYYDGVNDAAPLDPPPAVAIRAQLTQTERVLAARRAENRPDHADSMFYEGKHSGLAYALAELSRHGGSLPPDLAPGMSPSEWEFKGTIEHGKLIGPDGEEVHPFDGLTAHDPADRVDLLLAVAEEARHVHRALSGSEVVEELGAALRALNMEDPSEAADGE